MPTQVKLGPRLLRCLHCIAAQYRDLLVLQVSNGLQLCSIMSIADARARSTSDTWSQHAQYDNMSRHTPNLPQTSTRPPPGMPAQTHSNGFGRQKDNGVPVPGGGYRNNGHTQPHMFEMARSPPAAPNKSRLDIYMASSCLQVTRYQTRSMQVLQTRTVSSRNCMSILAFT